MDVPRKTPGPSGPAFPTPARWKEDVRSKMAELGWSQYELARAVGCTQPAIAWVLGPQAKQSSLVPRIHKALGLAPVSAPATHAVSPNRVELAGLLEDMDDEGIAHIIATARLITRSKKSE